jgi:hypothetical protein
MVEVLLWYNPKSFLLAKNCMIDTIDKVFSGQKLIEDLEIRGNNL